MKVVVGEAAVPRETSLLGGSKAFPASNYSRGISKEDGGFGMHMFGAAHVGPATCGLEQPVLFVVLAFLLLIGLWSMELFD